MQEEGEESAPKCKRCDIDARSNKVVVTASTKLDPNILIAKLRKSGKQAEPWPEQPMQQQQPPAESQSQEPKNQNDEPSKPNEPAEKPGADNAKASAAEPSNPQPALEPKQSTGETPKLAQESKDASNADASGNTGVETTAEAGQQQPEPKGKAKQQPEEKQPVDARVTVEYDRGVGSYVNRMPPPPQHPVHVMSYNVARPNPSASYYATAPAPAPAPAPMPMARPGPSQGYIDEHYTPSYYARSSPYEQYHYPPQPSPYRYQYQQQASTEDYYYGEPPQRSAFSPARDGYGDIFNDENANSCSVM
ncbi:pollen-specific leucine-rich repeat extensin-like protein 1 isoform X2 [Phragmites australis]|uniref:pollen-specific leucine-rich repeat extensin-like protein 1 isoform X2 n=1 Tax=Phragmites australis TaxID=29695 RepID=UPI002D7730C5|nr:pollen-specific leucine-rich repeat extensin-like protein 1 isoform X2 [Phragmites australis]